MLSAASEAADVREFLDEIARADGHPPLSEHKIAMLGEVGGLAGVWRDHVGLCLVAVAAWHPGDGHWAIEAAVAPRLRTAKDEVAAIERAAGIIPTGESHSFWAFRPEQVEAALGLGYEQVRAVLRMSGPMPTAGAASVPGIPIEPMAESDIEAIVGVNNRAFADHREQGSMTVDGFRSLMGLGWFDPGGVHVARSSDRIVGFCMTKHEEHALGEVFVLAVDPDLAGSGIGRALVDRALAGLADQGAVRAQAWVDADNLPAVGLYRALGLAEDFRTSEFVPATGGKGTAG